MTDTRVLSRIRTLTRELQRSLEYASADSTKSYWTAYQHRRSRASIGKKRAELHRLIWGLQCDPALGGRLLIVTEGLLDACAHDWRDDWERNGGRERGALGRAVGEFEREQKEILARLRRGKAATVDLDLEEIGL